MIKITPQKVSKKLINYVKIKICNAKQPFKNLDFLWFNK